MAHYSEYLRTRMLAGIRSAQLGRAPQAELLTCPPPLTA